MACGVPALKIAKGNAGGELAGVYCWPPPRTASRQWIPSSAPLWSRLSRDIGAAWYLSWLSIEAVMDELEKMGDVPHRLVHLEKNIDGTVSNVDLDSVEMNRLIAARLTEAVSNRLMSLENQDVVPFLWARCWAGTLLAGRGPDVHLQIVPASFVESEVVDTLEPAGINQTQHRVCIRFTVEMSAILPGYSTSVDVTDEVCVAQTLDRGAGAGIYDQRLMML